METKTRPSPEVLKWMVRLLPEQQRERELQWAAIASAAGEIGC
jgi:hypothetical protein